ncbi:SETMAR [Cordylochernes scorpioides]|uniref:SETMAR n=1 Tax=Cordylochernes scorpioides TaxID=51811 RepID=A0ABY6K9Y5_9ARAC|nr:SETMAR [Cordylochernes scorpioides]
MVYGKTIRLPGEFFDDSKHHLHAEEFVQQLQKQMELLKPLNEKHHSKTKVFVHKDLKTCSHVFIRTDRVKKPLEPPYEGPFPVLERTDKYFTFKVKGKNVTTSIDRLRPAYLLADSDNITAEHPTATRPIVSGALPSTSSQQNPDPPDVEKYTEFQGTGSAPDLTRTRSGRIIKKPIIQAGSRAVLRPSNVQVVALRNRIPERIRKNREFFQGSVEGWSKPLVFDRYDWFDSRIGHFFLIEKKKMLQWPPILAKIQPHQQVQVAKWSSGTFNIDVGVSVHPKALLKEMGRHDITFTADNAKDHYGGRKFRVHHDSQQLTFPKGIRLETKVLMDSSDNCHRANVHFLGYGPHALPRVSINLLLDIFDKFFASYPVRSTRVLFPCSYPLFVTVGLIKLLLDTINSGFGQLKKIHYLFGAPSGAQSNDDGSSIFKFSRDPGVPLYMKTKAAVYTWRLTQFLMLACFLESCRKSATDGHRLLCEAYGKHALSIKSCEYWFRRFKSGDFDTRDKERGGRPIKFEDAELEALLDKDSSQTQEELAETLGVTQQPGNIERHICTCELLLKRQNRKGFLHRIVTGDEKWIHYDNSKRRKSWVKPGHASTSTAKPNIHGKKLMLCIWWDQLGVIYYELLQPNETITGEGYQQQWMRLSRALKIKRPLYAKRHDKVIYHHDNARPHVAKVVKETLETLQWDVLPHPLYSPDIAPSDYHMFRSMTHGLAEQHFTSYEEAKNWVNVWIASKDVEFFQHGIRMLPERWEKVEETKNSTPFALSSKRCSPSSAGPAVLDLSSWSQGPRHHLSGEVCDLCFLPRSLNTWCHWKPAGDSPPNSTVLAEAPSTLYIV